jgi:putative oxidoreductase
MQSIAYLVARILLAQIFLLAGINKITGYPGTQAYMDAMGVPGMLLPLVILLEVGAGLAIIVGWKTRWAAIALSVFTLVAAFIFHSDFQDQMQMILFMKNLSITGGLMFVALVGAGSLSIEGRQA